MRFNSGKLRHQKSITDSDSGSVSSGQINLRTIYKGRGNYKDALVPGTSRQKSQFISLNEVLKLSSNKCRLSTSLQLKTPSPLFRKYNMSPSISQNTVKKLETLNCEEVQCQIKPKDDFKKIMERLNKLDEEAEELIRKKIIKITRKSNFITLKDKGSDDLSVQIENLICKVNDLKSDNVEKLGVSSEQIKLFMDRKIKLLQRLLASKSTQSDVLKKHFFAINTFNQRSRLATTLNLDRKQQFNKIKFPIKSNRVKTQGKQSICKQSSNQMAFLAPRPNQYETYRHKIRSHTVNTQPLPRSSYSSQFVTHGQYDQTFPYKNIDNVSFFGKAKLQSSTYSKDYKAGNAKLINHKELDSYRDKLKSIQISYAISNRRQQAEKYIEKSRRYIIEQLNMRHNMKNMKQITQTQEIRNPQNKVFHQSQRLSTQAKSQFMGVQQSHASCIKNKQLNSFKCAYRSLANS